MLERIADGRTDLVMDYVAEGHDAADKDDAGVSLLQWCAYYGDFSVNPERLSMEIYLRGKAHL